MNSQPHQLMNFNNTWETLFLNELPIHFCHLQQLIKKVSKKRFSLSAWCCMCPADKLPVAQHLKIGIWWRFVFFSIYSTAQYVSLTWNAWSPRIYRGNMAVTIHRAEKYWALQNTLLDFFCWKTQYTGKASFDILHDFIKRENLKIMTRTIATESAVDIVKRVEPLRKELYATS